MNNWSQDEKRVREAWLWSLLMLAGSFLAARLSILPILAFLVVSFLLIIYTLRMCNKYAIYEKKRWILLLVPLISFLLTLIVSVTGIIGMK